MIHTFKNLGTQDIFDGKDSKRMFEKWYSVIFITLLPPFPLVKGGNNKNPVPSPLQGEG